MYISRAKGENFIQVSVSSEDTNLKGLYIQTCGDEVTTSELQEGFGQIQGMAVPSNTELFNYSDEEVTQNLDVKVVPNTYDSVVKVSNELAVVFDGRVFQKVVTD
jgi:hypothetical protein